MEELIAEPDLDKNLKRIVAQITQYGKTLSDVKPSIEEAAHGYKIEKLRNARNQIGKQIKDLGMLFNIFQDNRPLQSSVLHIISTLEFGNEYIDNEYFKQSKTDFSNGEVGMERGRRNAPTEFKDKLEFLTEDVLDEEKKPDDQQNINANKS